MTTNQNFNLLGEGARPLTEHPGLRRAYRSDGMTLGIIAPPLEGFAGPVPTMADQSALVALMEDAGFAQYWVRDVPLLDPNFGGDTGRSSTPSPTSATWPRPRTGSPWARPVRCCRCDSRWTSPSCRQRRPALGRTVHPGGGGQWRPGRRVPGVRSAARPAWRAVPRVARLPPGRSGEPLPHRPLPPSASCRAPTCCPSDPRAAAPVHHRHVPTDGGVDRGQR